MEWTKELLTQVEGASRMILSYLDSDGYPIVLPFPLIFDRDKRYFSLPIPQHSPLPASKESVSLTLLHFDQHMKRERYTLFYGQLTETGQDWIFTPSHVVLPRWRRE